MKMEVNKVGHEKLVQMQVLCDRGQTDEEIATACGLGLEMVSSLIESNGWRESPLVERSEAHDYAASRRVLVKRWERAVGANARWMAMKGFGMIEESVTPRDFKDAAQGTKLLVEMAREAEGLDGKKEEKAVGGGISLFYIEAPIGRVEKRAEPVEKVDVEIETKPVEEI